MDQSVCASLSHTHYWYYELGMLKMPAFVSSLVQVRLDKGLFDVRVPQRNQYFSFATATAIFTLVADGVGENVSEKSTV